MRFYKLAWSMEWLRYIKEPDIGSLSIIIWFMSSQQKLFGVLAAALTPLSPDGSIALNELLPFLDFLYQRGCHGVLLLGTTGEGPSFSPAERLEILQVAVEIRQDHPDFLILVGTGTPSLEKTIELTRSAFNLEVDGVVVLPPYYFQNVSDAGLFEWFSRVIKRAIPSDGAFLGYHIPNMTRIPFSLELIQSLKDTFPGQFIGIKDSSSDPIFAQELGKRFGKELLVFSGNDRLFSLALDSCAVGCITAMANLFSRDSRQVWDANQRGQKLPEVQIRLDKARLLFDRYLPNPPLFKALLFRYGHFSRWAVRSPLVRMSDESLEKVISDLKGEFGEFTL